MWAHHARHWLANIYVTLSVTYSPFLQPDKAFSMVNVAVVFHSGCGHTAVIAEAVARGVEKIEGAVVKLIPVDAIDQHWSFLENDADAIIFGSPTCVGSVSAQF